MPQQPEYYISRSQFKTFRKHSDVIGLKCFNRFKRLGYTLWENPETYLGWWITKRKNGKIGTIHFSLENEIDLKFILRLDQTLTKSKMLPNDSYFLRNDLIYFELFIGLDKNIRIFNEMFRLGFYLVNAKSNNYPFRSGFRFSIDHYDKNSNKWRY